MNPSILAARIRATSVVGLNMAAERVRAVAVPLTPLEYGDLRSSLTVGTASEDDLEATVYSDLPYAVRQHEDLSYRHDDGQAKYLEQAGLDASDDVGQIIAAAVEKAFG